MNDLFEKLCDAELDRAAAAEICIDELLTLMQRHGGEECAEFGQLKAISLLMHGLGLVEDGAQKRHSRLSRVREQLTAAFPLSDEDMVSAKDSTP